MGLVVELELAIRWCWTQATGGMECPNSKNALNSHMTPAAVKRWPGGGASSGLAAAALFGAGFGRVKAAA